MATVRDLIKGSMRLLGVIAQGETPTAESQADALTALNSMLDTWSTNNLMILANVKETFPLIPSQQVYTMGPFGTFQTTRPLKIESALIQQVSVTTYEVPLQVINNDQWVDITVKSTQSTYPTVLFPQFTYPTVTLNFWPIPSLANNVVLWTQKALSSFASASDVLSLAPGYEEAIRYNLAVRLAPEYGLSASAEVVAFAVASLESVQRLNMQPLYLECDEALMSRSKTFNWLTGE